MANVSPGIQERLGYLSVTSVKQRSLTFMIRLIHIGSRLNQKANSRYVFGHKQRCFTLRVYRIHIASMV